MFIGFCQKMPLALFVSVFTISWWCKLLAFASQFCWPPLDLADVTCNMIPWLRSFALCSWAFALKQAIELFRNASGSSGYWRCGGGGAACCPGACCCWSFSLEEVTLLNVVDGWLGFEEFVLLLLFSVLIELVSSWSLLLLQLSDSLRCSAASKDFLCIPGTKRRERGSIKLCSMFQITRR